MNEGLLELKELVDALKTTTKSSEKAAILKQASEGTHGWLMMAYDKVGLVYHLTSGSVRKAKPMLDEGEVEDFRAVLLDLNKRNGAGTEEAERVKAAIQWAEIDDKDLLYSILDRDLGCGISVKTINKAIPGLIDVFEVALGEPVKGTRKVKGIPTPFDRTPKDLYDGNWLVSRKLDGIRCVAIKDKGAITCYTRKGRVFKTTKRLEESLAYVPDGVVLDGELCVVDEFGQEDFKAIQSRWNRKNYTLESFKYLVFDILTTDEFYGREQGEIFSVRAKEAQEFCEVLASPYVRAVPQTVVNSPEHYASCKQAVREEGWEGLILRKDALYKGKRSKDILKVKEFQDGEFKICDIDIGPFTVRTGGKESVIETVTSISVEFKGNTVGVGSGFTLAERNDIKNNPENYLDKYATIKYFEESEDELGQSSLRFPVFKGLREGGD